MRKPKNPTPSRKTGHPTRAMAEAALADAFSIVRGLVDQPPNRATFIKLTRVLRVLAPYEKRA